MREEKWFVMKYDEVVGSLTSYAEAYVFYKGVESRNKTLIGPLQDLNELRKTIRVREPDNPQEGLSIYM